MKKHFIRIVGGEYRRTTIAVPDVPGLRPTPDRVRETLFNWLHHLWGGRFEGRRVLDLFAGTGAIGFEAASRGVAHVQMVESHPVAVTALRALRNRLQANQVRIHAGDARHVLERLRHTAFDLIALDPPFGQDHLKPLWPLLASLVTPETLIYVESDRPLTPPPGYAPIRNGRAGRVHFYLWRFDAPQKTDNNPSEHTAHIHVPQP